MPERKSHFKSRHGCAQCKARRVKCDEVRPHCSNCKRRQESCSYMKPSRNLSATPSPDSSVFEQSNGGSNIRQLHLKELELMHHYSTSTYATIAMTSREEDLSRFEIPRLALAHGFLLDTVFALTSLHLASERPDDAPGLVAEAVRYQTRALASCRQRLESLSASECQAMFHCSAQLGIIALAFRSVDLEIANSCTPTETLVQLGQLWRGTSSILTASKDLLDEETYQIYFPHPDWDERKLDESESKPLKFLEKMRFRAQADAVLKDTPLTNGQSSENDSAIYLEAIDRLNELFMAWTLDHTRVLAWVVIIPARFHELLYDRQPLANAIVLLYSLLLVGMESRWWAKDFRRQVVHELVPQVASYDSELAEIATWVQSRMGNLSSTAADLSRSIREEP